MRVIATDSSDGLSSTAAVASWTIDLTQPIVTITSQPAPLTNTRRHRGVQRHQHDRPERTDQLHLFARRGRVLPCASPAVYTAGAGAHTVRVIATDSSDGLSSTPPWRAGRSTDAPH